MTTPKYFPGDIRIKIRNAEINMDNDEKTENLLNLNSMDENLR